MAPRRTIFILTLAAILLAAHQSSAETAVPADQQAESVVNSEVTSDELFALANEVNLPAWTQLALSRDFTDIAEGWVTIYSPKDAVGAARNWNVQVKTARSLAVRTSKAGQKRWLDLFIRAGEAVGHQNAAQFTAALRALDGGLPTGRMAITNNRNFFTAK